MLDFLDNQLDDNQSASRWCDVSSGCCTEVVYKFWLFSDSALTRVTWAWLWWFAQVLQKKQTTLGPAQILKSHEVKYSLGKNDDTLAWLWYHSTMNLLQEWTHTGQFSGCRSARSVCFAYVQPSVLVHHQHINTELLLFIVLSLSL